MYKYQSSTYVLVLFITFFYVLYVHLCALQNKRLFSCNVRYSLFERRLIFLIYILYKRVTCMNIFIFLIYLWGLYALIFVFHILKVPNIIYLPIQLYRVYYIQEFSLVSILFIWIKMILWRKWKTLLCSGDFTINSVVKYLFGTK